jgi:hypothetical protein
MFCSAYFLSPFALVTPSTPSWIAKGFFFPILQCPFHLHQFSLCLCFWLFVMVPAYRDQMKHWHPRQLTIEWFRILSVSRLRGEKGMVTMKTRVLSGEVLHLGCLSWSIVLKLTCHRFTMWGTIHGFYRHICHGNESTEIKHVLVRCGLTCLKIGSCQFWYFRAQKWMATRTGVISIKVYSDQTLCSKGYFCITLFANDRIYEVLFKSQRTTWLRCKEYTP